MNDLVTIVVPIYKVEKLLRRCVDSILSQSYKNIEVILVPQPGGDECEAICREYEERDSRVVVIPQQICGPGNARNVGIENAHGEFITFVDSDDIIDSELVHDLYKLQQEHYADLVQCRSFCFLEEEQILEKKNINEEIQVLYGTTFCRNCLRNYYGTDTGVVMAKLYKKSLLEGIRFPATRTNEDGAFLYKVYYASSKTVLSSQQLYYYQSKRGGSITHSDNRRLYLDSVLSAEEQVDFFGEAGDSELLELATYSYYNVLLRTLSVLHKNEQQYTDYRGKQKQIFGVIWKSAYISKSKKFIGLVGRISPKCWMMIWRGRNRIRSFWQWNVVRKK